MTDTKSLSAWFPTYGLSVEVYVSEEDGATVVQIDGAPDNDPDCENVRVYLNDGLVGGTVEADCDGMEYTPDDDPLTT